MIIKFYKTIALGLFFIFIITGCGGIHKISRIGYNIESYTKSGCTVYFTRELKSNVKLDSKGSIALTDNGSSKCSPKDAFNILRNEACELDANLVVISNERMPDFVSSCYRCDAVFYRVDTSYVKTNYKVDDLISDQSIESLTNKSNTSNPFIYIGGFAIGFALGWLIVKALKN